MRKSRIEEWNRRRENIKRIMGEDILGSWEERVKNIREANKVARDLGYARGIKQYIEENKNDKKNK